MTLFVGKTLGRPSPLGIIKSVNSPVLSETRVKLFRSTVYTYFEEHGRNLPWRFCGRPYYVLVSEVMLQQTQVERVTDKFHEFVAMFPTLHDLAQASPGQVLKTWQGLGYNRRALFLQKAARTVVEQYGGLIPQQPDELRKLPGIGKATAASIAAFAFDFPSVFIETNIRTVFIHTFFPDEEEIPDERLVPLVEQTLDRKQVGRWYNALMDYGVMIKKNNPNPGRKSRGYVRQGAFEGSDRQIRGAIVRFFLDHKPHTLCSIQRHLNQDHKRIKALVERLADEGFIRKVRQSYQIL